MRAALTILGIGTKKGGMGREGAFGEYGSSDRHTY